MNGEERPSACLISSWITYLYFAVAVHYIHLDEKKGFLILEAGYERASGCPNPAAPILVSLLRHLAKIVLVGGQE